MASRPPAAEPPHAAPVAGAARPAFRVEGVEGGVARLVFDAPGPVNLVGASAVEDLDAALAELEVRIAAEKVAAVVLRSAKEGFSPGADLDEVRAFRTAHDAAAAARRGQAVLRRLERLPVPTFAAVDGTCLGAGAALALACSYRLASDSPRTRFGFPEVRFGLVPALGVSVRLPRLVGLGTALDLMLLSPGAFADEARRAGLVDAVLPARAFHHRVDGFVRERLERGRGRTGARRGLGRRLLEDTAPGRRAVFIRVRRVLAADDRLTPAARATLAVVADSLALPLDAGFHREAEAFGAMTERPESRGTLHAGAALRAARRTVRLLEPEQAGLEAVGVLGGGEAAGALAFSLALAGLSVRLREPRRPAAEDAVRTFDAYLAAARRGRRVTRREAEAISERFSAGRGFGRFGTVQLVLAAPTVLQEEALAEAADHVVDGCALARLEPETALDAEPGGSSPALRLYPSPGAPLLAEIAAPAAAGGAGREAAGMLAAVIRRVGASGLVLPPEPGGVAGPLLAAWIGEALRLAAAGAAPGVLDAAAVATGFAIGPLELLRRVGPGRLAALATSLPASAGAGDLPRLIREHGAEQKAAAAPDGGPEWAERMHLALMAAAARLVDAGTAAPHEVDVAARFALAYPAAGGGPLYEVDRRGAGAVAAALHALAAEHGPRFAPAPLLQRLAAGTSGFHAPSAAMSALDTPRAD